MKKTLIFGILLVQLCFASSEETRDVKIAAAKKLEGTKTLFTPMRSLNLILLLDGNSEDPVGGPLTYEFGLSLQQKAAPIIVSENIAQIFFTLRQEATPDIKTSEQAKTNYASIKKLNDEQDKIFNQLNKELQLLIDNIRSYQATLQRKDLTALEKKISADPTITHVYRNLINTIAEKLPTAEPHINIIREIITWLDNLYNRLNHENQSQYLSTFNLFDLELQEATLRNNNAQLNLKITNYGDELLKKINEFMPKERGISYAKVSFELAEWNFYKASKGPFYLFLPKKYLENCEKEFSEFLKELERTTHEPIPESKTDYSHQEKAIGLTIDHDELLTKLSFSRQEDLLAYINEHQRKPVGFNTLLPSLIFFSIPFQIIVELFVPGKEVSLGSWDIYLSGHGMYKEPRSPIDYNYFQSIANELELYAEYFDDRIAEKPLLDQTQFQVFGNKINSLAQDYFDTKDAWKTFILKFHPDQPDIVKQASAIGIDVNNTQLFAQYLYRLASTIQAIIKAVKEAIEKSPETGKIAGLTYPQFEKFLSFLRKKIKTTFLFYTTCFAGGVNLVQVQKYLDSLEKDQNRILNNFDADFIIVAGVITDIPTWHTTTIKEQESSLNFIGFFADLKKFFSRQGTFEKNPIYTIVNNVTDRDRTIKSPYGISNIPSVYFPALGIFRAQEIDKELMILTNAKLKALQLIVPHTKKTSIESINTTGKSALLLYPLVINVPVILGVDSKNLPTVLLAMDGDTLFFSSIQARSISLDSFLLNSIMNVRSVMPRTFAVKELLINNYEKSGIKTDGPLHIKNLLIESSISENKEIIMWKLLMLVQAPGATETAYTATVTDTEKYLENKTERVLNALIWQQTSLDEAKKSWEGFMKNFIEKLPIDEQEKVQKIEAAKA